VPPEPAATKTDFSKVGWFLAGVAAAALVNEFTKRY
jgi:hypothetical protein